jgi:VanZ family protein
MVWVNRDTKMLDSLKWRKFTLALIVLAVPFFFIGGPSSVSLDVHRRFWDLGHSIFFALVAINLVWWKIVKTPKQFSISFVAVVLLSLLIEKLQTYVGRDASWSDVLANMAGLLLGYTLTQTASRSIILLRALSLIGLMPGLWSFFKSAAVSFILWQQFPLLSGGDSSWESVVWGGKSEITRIASPEKTQRVYLVRYSGEAYQSADMMGFIQPWIDYQRLILEIENPSSEALSIVLRISDKQHELSEQKYNDRFNRRIHLLPGWNQIEVSISDIENAPADRKMNLHEIYLLKLFLPESGKAKELYLNKIYLQ